MTVDIEFDASEPRQGPALAGPKALGKTKVVVGGSEQLLRLTFKDEDARWLAGQILRDLDHLGLDPDEDPWLALGRALATGFQLLGTKWHAWFCEQTLEEQGRVLKKAIENLG